MEIRVRSVSVDGVVTFVTFDCTCGDGRAAWIGDPPAIGEVKHVELGLDEAYSVGRDMIESPDEPRLMLVAGETIIVARIVTVEGDGTVTIDVCGEEFGARVTGPPPCPGKVYRLTTRALRAYDSNY